MDIVGCDHSTEYIEISIQIKKRGDKMTFELLEKIIDDNNIPHDVTLRSNSGWECDPTEMDGVWYRKKDNLIHFTQNGWGGDEKNQGFKCLHGETFEEMQVRIEKWRKGVRK